MAWPTMLQTGPLNTQQQQSTTINCQQPKWFLEDPHPKHPAKSFGLPYGATLV
jgi:hypothetical protein